MRRNQRSNHRVMASLTLNEYKQLLDIVEFMDCCRDNLMPATISEAIRLSLRELHAALAEKHLLPAADEEDDNEQETTGGGGGEQRPSAEAVSG